MKIPIPIWNVRSNEIISRLNQHLNLDLDYNNNTTRVLLHPLKRSKTFYPLSHCQIIYGLLFETKTMALLSIYNPLIILYQSDKLFSLDSLSHGIVKQSEKSQFSISFEEFAQVLVCFSLQFKSISKPVGNLSQFYKNLD